MATTKTTTPAISDLDDAHQIAVKNARKAGIDILRTWTEYARARQFYPAEEAIKIEITPETIADINAVDPLTFLKEMTKSAQVYCGWLGRFA